MSEMTRLGRVLAFIKEKGWDYRTSMEDGCGSIDFDYRGVPYHIWEFYDGEWGVETNLRHGGQQEELFGDYEEEMLKIMKAWH